MRRNQASLSPGNLKFGSPGGTDGGGGGDKEVVPGVSCSMMDGFNFTADCC